MHNKDSENSMLGTLMIFYILFYDICRNFNTVCSENLGSIQSTVEFLLKVCTAPNCWRRIYLIFTALNPLISRSLSWFVIHGKTYYFQRRREEDRDGGQEAGISAHPPAQEHSASASHTKSTDDQVLNLTTYLRY
jgi:hypothetical protein